MDKNKEKSREDFKKKGCVYVNTYSQDCDGVERYTSCRFESLEDYDESYNSFIESIEGQSSWDIVSKQDLTPPEECGTFGHGWDIN